jgi:mannosyltransferase
MYKLIKYNIGLIIFIATYLRLTGLGLNNIWRDEAYTWATYQYGFNKIFDITKFDTHPPLHNFLMFLWTRIFGESELGIRSLSLVFGVACVYVTYLLAYKHTKNLSISALSAIIVAVNPQLIIYSQEGRSYSLLVLITLLTFYYLSEVINTKNSILLAITAIIGLYTHNLYIPILFIAIIWHLSFYRPYKQDLKKYLITASAIFVAYIPYLLVISNAIREKEEFWLKFDPIKDFVFGNQFLSLFTSQNYDQNNQYSNVYLTGIILPMVILIISGVISEFRSNRGRLIAIPLSLLVSLYLISFKSPVYNVRYIQHAIPFLAIIMAIGGFWILYKSKALFSLTVFPLIFCSILLFTGTIVDTPKATRFDQAVTSLKENNVKTIIHPFPDFTYDVIGYYSKRINYQPINLALNYPQGSKKNFQKGYITTDKAVGDLSKLDSFVLINQWVNNEAKNFVEAQNFCLINTLNVSGVVMDYYNKCEI